MRISEKTIEINFCSQIADRISQPIIWFGLTQMQEARAGFDTCTQIGGRLFVFQFKASAYVLRSGARRFSANHDQLQNLRNSCRSSRSVFYVFPLIGTTIELSRNSDLLAQSGLLDVSTLPPLAPPTTRAGTVRVNRNHYVDVVPYSAVFHSKPTEIEMISTAVFVEQFLASSEGLKLPRTAEDFYRFTKLLSRNSVGAVLA